VDIAYIPFVERFQIFLSDVSKYDITAGRPKLAKWIEVHVKPCDCYSQFSLSSTSWHLSLPLS